jgi:predicted glycogen debranching enzyme
MGYIKFVKSQLINLEYSLNREILRTSRTGAYASTTIPYCNTRKYHGLLVAPQPHLDDDYHVFLSSFDETVIQHETAFNLGIHKYPGGIFRPGGHKYIRDFESEPIPTLIYRVGGVVLKKETLFTFHTERFLIRYTLMDAKSPTKLQFWPFLAFRGRHSLSKANTFVNKKYEPVDNGIKIRMYDSYDPLYMQFSKKVDYVHVPDWYYNIEYYREQQRGYAYQEDLYVPGFFETDIKKGESVIFVASLDEIKPESTKNMFYRERKKRIPRDSFVHSLQNSADQFVIKQNDGTRIVAGYPWFKTGGRDTFISAPGLLLSRNLEKDFLNVLDTAVKTMEGPFFPKIANPKKTTETDSVDAPLWFVWSIQQWANYTQDLARAWKKFGKPVKNILEGFKEHTGFDIFVTEEGLLWAGNPSTALTWMDATINKKPVTSRYGMPVEVNALWYNAIRFAVDAARAAGDSVFAHEWEAVADRLAVAFSEKFWSKEKGYLADVVNHDGADWSVRPNMVIAASMPFCMLSEGQCMEVLHTVKEHLVTKRGLRSLSPQNPDYKGTYTGNPDERNQAYHQGTVWPWLLGHFAEAWLKLHGAEGIGYIKKLFLGFEDEMSNHGIGSVSEVYNGNPPFEAGGSISQAWNVAELLRINEMIKKYNE